MAPLIKKIAAKSSEILSIFIPASIDYLKKGNALLAAGELAAAKTAYEKAILKNPKKIDAYINAAFVLIEQRQHHKAKTYIATALKLEHRCVDAHYMLGVIAQSEQDYKKAAACFLQATSIDSHFEPAHQKLIESYIQDNNLEQAKKILLHDISHNETAATYCQLGDIFYMENNLEEASQCFSKAIEVDEKSALAHCRLGDVFQKQDRVQSSIDQYQKALHIDPRYVEALNNFASLLHAQHQDDQAIEYFRSALGIDPANAQIHYNLGNAYKQKKDFDKALYCYQTAIELDASNVNAYNNLGATLQEKGDFTGALAHYEKALLVAPEASNTHYCLGNLYQAMGDLSKAVMSYSKSILCQPNVDAYNNLGNVYQLQGHLTMAVEQYKKAIELRSSSASAHNNLGGAFKELNELDKAAYHFRQAINYRPNFAYAHNNLAGVLHLEGKYADALHHYEQALFFEPDNLFVHSNLLFCKTVNMSAIDDHYNKQLKAYGALASAKARTYNSWLVDLSERIDQPLRVGIVSGDFKQHPVGYFIENILSNINNKKIELLAYVTHPKEDELTIRIKSFFSAWTMIAHLSDEEAARQIRADRIDMLIDLAGHTGHNRVALFAWKPAPVEVTWLGYWASTGVEQMDYIVADEISLPAAHQPHFTEQVFYLPDTRMCFTPPDSELPVALLPALRNGYITFGSFQNMSKIRDEVIALWGKVLMAIPAARLRLQNNQLSDEQTQSHLKKRLTTAGISLERVVLVGGVTRHAYLEAHAEVDIILDTFPFSGGTTTCEALWMGVPTVTLAGQTLIARQGAALLTCAGLSDWVASTENEYIDIACQQAQHIDVLAQLRARLRQQVQSSPLFDAPTFTQHFEKALHAMWNKKIAEFNA